MMETLLLVSQHRNRTFQSGIGILPNPLLACTTPRTKQACSSSASPKTPSPSVYPHLSDESEHQNRFAKIGTMPISINLEADHNKEEFIGDFPHSELWAGPAYSNSPLPSPSVYPHPYDESVHLNRFAKIGTMPISIILEADHNKEFNDDFPHSELWAGPAYSNSPPPSSLPIPKFSLRPKRSVSLNLPLSSASDISFHHIVKSAPPSPTRDHMSSLSRDLFHSDDSATKTLRRILNLDVADE